MPNTLSFSMEYRSRLPLLQIRAVFSMLCKSEIKNDMDVKKYGQADIITILLGTVFHYTHIFGNEITFPTPPETCIADSEDGVTINTLQDFNGIFSISIFIGACEGCEILGVMVNSFKCIAGT